MKDFIKKNKKKVIFILSIIILLAIVCIYNIVKSPKEIGKIENEEIKASVETVPDGYIGIYNAQDLRNMANDLAGKYILMADINMAGEAWEPIGTNQSFAFTGIFEGNDHTISNLTIESSNQYVGMFGYVKAGTVQNLKLESVNITNSLTKVSSYTGGIVGYSTGTINNIEIISGEITGGGYTGGIVGYTTKAITQVTNRGKVTGGNTGGIVGETTGAITQATNSGEITGTGATGGIVGLTTMGVTEATNNGTIIGSTSQAIGGIAGKIEPSISTEISNIENRGIVKHIGTSSTRWVGGIVGQIYSSNYKITVTNAKNSGDISGGATGGILGIIESTIVSITEVENSGNVTGTAYVGGIVGQKYNSTNSLMIKKAINKGTITGEGNTGGILGSTSGLSKTTELTISESENSGDISGGTTGGIVGDYRGRAITNVKNSGNITGTGYVGGIAGYANDTNATITNATNSGTIVGEGNYTGGIAGQGNATIKKAENVGNVKSTKSSSNVGGIAGTTTSSIIETKNSGNIIGGTTTGGIAGNVGGTGYIQMCYSTGKIEVDLKGEGSYITGGIIGNVGGSPIIEKCYARNDIVTKGCKKGFYPRVGGLIGHLNRFNKPVMQQ